MKIFFDTEFTGLHKNTTLISIGLVSENNKKFYAELTDYDPSQCDTWVKNNVLSKLIYNNYDSPYVPNYYIGHNRLIHRMLLNWLKQFDEIEFVSDVCHYDMVLLMDLLSPIPTGMNICPACYDINQDIMRYYSCDIQNAFDMSREQILADLDISIDENKHNALYDAIVIKELHEILNKYNTTRGAE